MEQQTYNIFVDPTSDNVIVKTRTEQSPFMPGQPDIKSRISFSDKPFGDKPSCFESRCTSCPFKNKCKNAEESTLFKIQFSPIKISSKP